MRRSVTLWMVAGLLLGAGSVFATPVVSIQPSVSTIAPGDSLTLDVDIADVTDLFAFQFDLGFDPTALAAAGVTEGDFLPAGGTTLFIPGAIDDAAGSIAATADALFGTSVVTGSGALARVALNALASGTSPITLSNVILLDSSLNDIPFTLSSGTVDVRGASPVPEPTPLTLLGTGGLTLLLQRKKALNQRLLIAYLAWRQRFIAPRPNYPVTLSSLSPSGAPPNSASSAKRPPS
jgi:hypothetical protein